jgi:hypothetical protein
VSSWGAEAYNKAGAWTAESAATGKEWLTAADKKLDTMLEPKTPEEARTALDTMADTALVRLFNEQPSAKLLFDKAYGYAVFDSRKFSLMIHTNQGAGVAVNRTSGKHTYMKMFGAGLAAGIGGKFYQQVILFEDKARFDAFVSKGWKPPPRWAPWRARRAPSSPPNTMAAWPSTRLARRGCCWTPTSRAPSTGWMMT